MKSSFSIALLSLGLAETCLAGSVELNGLTCLLGEKTAFMVLRQPFQEPPVSFALSEGGSQFGIKLLVIDLAHHSAKIEQAGQIEELRLCSAPDLTVPPDPAELPPGVATVNRLTPQAQFRLNQFLANDQEVQRIKAGSPIATPRSLGAAYQANTKLDSTPDPDNASTPAENPDYAVAGGATANARVTVSGQPVELSTGTAADSAVDETKQYWYVTSLSIERNRIATAAEVANGEMDPLPRTPLTPAQTPANLIGPETFFPTHIPGFVFTGSVDG